MLVPAHEAGEALARSVFEAGDEIFDSGGSAVAALEIELHAAFERVFANDPLQHANDFAALFIDGRSVKVVDLLIARWPHRMRERARVFAELTRAQALHVLDALHRARALVSGELLLAINREAFFQTELKPVTARDAIAGPVVEIFMADDGFDGFEVCIRRGLGVSQDQRRVEDVEAFVFHRAEIKIAYGDDVEEIEIVFSLEDVFVPFHRALQRVHGVECAAGIAFVDIDAEIDFAAALGGEAVVDRLVAAGAEREEVRGLRVRIDPHRVVTPTFHIAALGEIAV